MKTSSTFKQIFLWLSFFGSSTQAAQQLEFPIQKNQAQILPQRFDYSIEDQVIDLGGEKLNLKGLIFSVQAFQLNTKKPVKTRFEWSGHLFHDGALVLLDSNGKSLWRKNIPKDLAAKGNKFEVLENNFPYSVLEQLQLYPFFRFCVSSEEVGAQIQQCSQELYFLKDEKKIFRLKSRSRTTAEPTIEINGQEVGPRGTIYLQTEKDPILMKVTFTSGRTLGIESRRNNFIFRDVQDHPSDSSKMMVTGSGAEPFDESQAQAVGEKNWQFVVEKSRPQIYLRGKAGLPLLQEIVLKADVRPKELEVSSMEEIPQKVYSDTLKLSLTRPPGWSLKAGPLSRVLQDEGEDFEWELLGLKQDRQESRKLTLGLADKSFDAVLQVERFPSQVLTWGFSSLGAVDLSYQKWFSNLRWGVSAQAEQNFISSIGTRGLQSNYSLLILGRTTKGIVIVDPSLVIGVGISLPKTLEKANPSLDLKVFQRSSTSVLGFQNSQWEFLATRALSTTEATQTQNLKLAYRLIGQPKSLGAFWTEFNLNRRTRIDGEETLQSFEGQLLIGLENLF